MVPYCVSLNQPPSFCNSPDREKRKAAFQISWYRHRLRSEVETRRRSARFAPAFGSLALPGSAWRARKPRRPRGQEIRLEGGTEASLNVLRLPVSESVGRREERIDAKRVQILNQKQRSEKEWRIKIGMPLASDSLPVCAAAQPRRICGRADENTHRFIYFLTDTPTESTCAIK